MWTILTSRSIYDKQFCNLLVVCVLICVGRGGHEVGSEGDTIPLLCGKQIPEERQMGERLPRPSWNQVFFQLNTTALEKERK